MLEDLVKPIAATLVALPLLAGCATTNLEQTSISETREYQTESGLKPNMYGPVWKAPDWSLPENRCASYAVTTSRKIFDKDMIYADAWDIGYKNKIVSKVEGEDHLEELIENKTLTPGMIVTMHYPLSSFNKGKDMKGNDRKYTHLTTFAGTNKEGEPTFYHQFRTTVEKITLKELLKKYGSYPIEVIDER